MFNQKIDRKQTGSLKWQKYAGKDIIPLWVADMDFASPPPVLDALHARVDHGVMGYTKPYESVEQEVIAYLKREHGYEVKAEWLFWLPGIVPALNLICQAFANEGGGVMINSPVYPPFIFAPQWQGSTLQDVPLIVDANDRWTLDFDGMEAAVTPETKVYILCSPHNPVGRVFDREELERLVDFCRRHDLLLISDEIHCDLVLDHDVKHITTATANEEAAKRTMTLMAPSKTYNVPGLACAFAILPEAKMRLAMMKACRGIITEINCFGYAGCEAAYKHGEPWRQELLKVLRSNRELVYSFIAEHTPEISLRPMQAMYLAWMDVSALGLENPCAYFESHGVGLSDGADFGDPTHLRLNFACPREQLQAGLDRMRVAVETWRAKA